VGQRGGVARRGEREDVKALGSRRRRAMSTAGKIFPDIMARRSKQDRKRWRLVVAWTSYEYQ